MTNPNLQKLETAIREALLELMELSEGCEVQRIAKRINTYKVLKVMGEDVELLELKSGFEVKVHKRDVYNMLKIIGHPVTLLHLLRWLKFNKYYLGIDFDEYLLFLAVSNIPKIKLDLSKPLLSQQSQEVIDELVKLVK